MSDEYGGLRWIPEPVIYIQSDEEKAFEEKWLDVQNEWFNALCAHFAVMTEELKNV